MALDLTKVGGLGMDELDPANNLPLIKILQRASAEVDETHKEHDTKKVEGAKAGDILFTATGDAQKSVRVIPLAQRSMYAKWKPKSEGGGMVGHAGANVILEEGYRKVENKETLVEDGITLDLKFTSYLAVLVESEGEWHRGIIAFASSQLKHMRAWNRQIRGFKYPDSKQFKGVKPFICSCVWKLSTVVESNDENSWYNYKIERDTILDPTKDEDVLNLAIDSVSDAVDDLPKLQEVAAEKALPSPEVVVDDEDSPF